jgi:hypothetical protein
MEWAADAPLLKSACLEAVINALGNEDRDGFGISPIAHVHVKDWEGPVLQRVPEHIQGNELLAFLGKLGAEHQAERVTFAFVDTAEQINVFVMKPSGYVYHVQGRIEGTKFVRTRLIGENPKR